jgi:hypothetical protein
MVRGIERKKCPAQNLLSPWALPAGAATIVLRLQRTTAPTKIREYVGHSRDPRSSSVCTYLTKASGGLEVSLDPAQKGVVVLQVGAFWPPTATL